MENLAAYLGTTVKRGDVGIEVEVESNKPFSPLSADSPWVGVRDGSLRSNHPMEFISRNPFKLSNAREKIETLVKFIGTHKGVDRESPRTSIHVHTNCLGLTPKQIWTGITFAWIVEPLLMPFCGKNRQGNQYCIPVMFGESVISTAREDIEKQKLFRSFIPDYHKYAFTALHNLRDKGTIEHRGMGGVYDTETIDTWTRICYTTIHGAVKLFKDPVDVVEMLGDIDRCVQVLHGVYGYELATKIINKNSDKSIPQLIEQGLCSVYSMVYSVDWDTWGQNIKSPEKAKGDINNLVNDDILGNVFVRMDA